MLLLHCLFAALLTVLTGVQAASADMNKRLSVDSVLKSSAPLLSSSTPLGMHVSIDIKFALLSRMIKDIKLLQSAKLVQVDRHCTKTPVPHRFLVIHLKCKDDPKELFLRLDRRPDPTLSPLGFASRSGVTGTNDTVGLSELVHPAPRITYGITIRRDLKHWNIMLSVAQLDQRPTLRPASGFLTFASRQHYQILMRSWMS